MIELKAMLKSRGYEARSIPPPEYDTGARRHRILDELRDLWRYRDLIRNLVRRNVTARYKRSLLGVLWTLMDPLLMMLVMAFIYTALFARAIEDFPVFLFSGLIAWNYFSQSSQQAMSDLVYSGGLIGKVYMPKSAFTVAAVGTGVVNFGLSFIVLVGLMLFYGRPFSLALMSLPFSVIVITFFTLGVGFFMSSFAVFFPDILNIYRILLRLVMFLSGIFYTLDFLPERMGQVIGLNPGYHLVSIFRDPIYNAAFPSLNSMLYSTLWSFLAFAVGIWVFTSFSDQYGYRI